MAKAKTKKPTSKRLGALQLTVDTRSLETAINRAVVNARWVRAFNDWMQDFVNDPEKFKSTTASALEFMRERVSGREPTYGESCAVCLQAYLDRQN